VGVEAAATRVAAAVIIATAMVEAAPTPVGAAPLGRPSTTPESAPSTCGRARPGRRSCPGRRTPSLLHHRWGHRSRLLWRLYLFLELHHLSRSPGCRDQGSGIHSPSSAPSVPWSSLPPHPSPIGWLTLTPPTTPPRTQVTFPLPAPLRLSIPFHHCW
jgi:hypothetical protein